MVPNHQAVEVPVLCWLSQLSFKWWLRFHLYPHFIAWFPSFSELMSCGCSDKSHWVQISHPHLWSNNHDKLVILCIYIYTMYIYIYCICIYDYIYIWRFPKLRVPPVLIHLVRWIFHETIQLWGSPHDGLATPQADGHRPIRAPHQAVEMRTSTCDGKSPFMSKRLKGDRSGWSHYDLIMIFFIIIWMIHNHWYDWYEIRNDKNVSYVS
jgi:hypothetical protein